MGSTGLEPASDLELVMLCQPRHRYIATGLPFEPPFLLYGFRAPLVHMQCWMKYRNSQ